MSKIKSISFLYKDERVVIKTSKSGKFRIPLTTGTKTVYKDLSAQEVMKLREVKNGDPVITTTNGEKLRVFQGGDPTYLPAMADGLLQKHDAQFATTKTLPRSSFSQPRDENRRDVHSTFDWMDDDYGI